MADAREFTLVERQGVWYASGPLNEYARFGEILAEKATVRLNLSGITRSNSLGVKIFIRFITQLAGMRVELLECSYTILELFNTIPASLGTPPEPDRVKSFHLPFVCASGHMETRTFQREGLDAAPLTGTCPQCKQPSRLEGTLEDYLGFLLED